MELMTASKQWATRPSDQRFVSLTEMQEFATKARRNSKASVVPSRSLYLRPVEDNEGLEVLVGDEPASSTNWSFGQLASLAGAPAGYLRDLPSPLAADNLNYGLQVNRDVEDVGVLVTNGEGPKMLRAATGPNYGRVWNEEVIRALVNRFGDGVTGDFRVPGEFGKAVTVTKANTTLYASDRDMFVFLADEQNRIEMPDRRDGKAGSLARGFFVWNSEVGDTVLGVGLFLFDYTCSNRIVWGAQDYTEIKVRHTSRAPYRWLNEAMPTIEQYANEAAAPMVAKLEAARASRIDNLDAFLKSRFTRPQAIGIKAAFEADEGEGRQIETLWDATTAITAYARTKPYQQDRVALEREGGKVLALAA